MPTNLIANKFVNIPSTAIGTAAAIWTPSGTRSIRLLGGLVSVSAAVSIQLQHGGGPTLDFLIPVLAVNTPVLFDLSNTEGIPIGNVALQALGSGAANLTGTVWGIEE